jgi:ribosomal protein S18 acetylase RimI-like enzyme
MATMRPTPRNELLGLLSDAYQWMQSPERTQQMQGFAGLLGTTGVPQTVERMAYGEPLTNIGRANVPLLKPETADALMTVAPFAPKGMKMIRATEGLPVGMSIKDVGNKSINVSLNEASNFLSAKSEFGQVGGTIRQPDRLSDTPYLQINYAEVEKASRGKGKGKELYQALIDEAKARGLRVFSDSTVEKPAVNVYKSLEKGGYKLRDMTTGSLEDGTVYGAGANKPAFEISSMPSMQASQQAALDLAQQKPGLLEMTRTPSEAEIKKMSREDLIDWLQNNDPNGQYMDPTPNPSISMYRTGKGYAVENADSGDVFEFKDFNEAQEEFNSMRFSNAEFPPMTLQDAQESAINYLREFAQPAESAKVLQFGKKQTGLLGQ